MTLLERCEGRWFDILATLGIDKSFLSGRNGPCPMCSGRDRWRWTDHKQAGMWVCNQCGTGNGINLLMQYHGWDFKQCAQEIEKIIGSTTYHKQKKPSEDECLDKMRAVWSSTKPVTKGDPVDKYLCSRNIDLPRFPKIMRYAPLLHHPDGRFHGMVCAISDAQGKIVNLHRTFLNEDGTKTETTKAKNKLTMRGSIPEGSSIKLYGHKGRLAIAEGIETALRYMVLHKVPAWPCVASKRLSTFMPDDDVTELIIAGDNDESFTGQKAMFEAANRIWVERKKRGIPIKITPHLAPDLGKDWADY